MRKIRIGSKVLYQTEFEYGNDGLYTKEEGIVSEQVRKDDGIWYYLVNEKGEGLGYFDEVWLPPTRSEIFQERCKNIYERWRRHKNMTPEQRARERERTKMMDKVTKTMLMFGEQASEDLKFFKGLN